MIPSNHMGASAYDPQVHHVVECPQPSFKNYCCLQMPAPSQSYMKICDSKVFEFVSYHQSISNDTDQNTWRQYQQLVARNPLL